MNTLASRNPDKKIKATAALDNSQKKSSKLDTNYYKNAAASNGNDTLDLKFCSAYEQKGKYHLQLIKLLLVCWNKRSVVFNL